MNTILKKQIFPDGQYEAELISVELMNKEGIQKIKADYLISKPDDQKNKVYSHYITINPKALPFIRLYSKLIMPDVEVDLDNFDEIHFLDQLSDHIGKKLSFNLFNKNGFQNCAILKSWEEK